MASGTPEAQVPFNFFAGQTPMDPTPLAWTEGYLYVITSIIVTADLAASENQFLLTDASGNRRIQTTLINPSQQEGAVFSWGGEMVMGPNSGATVQGTDANVFCSIDGYAFAPVGSSIW